MSSTIAMGQGATPERASESPSNSHDASKESLFPNPSQLFTPLKSPALADPYRPITPSERLRWFVSSTTGPAHMAGAAIVAALGTAVDRPKEYGTHWGGFANRFGSGMAGSATSNAMEAGVGLILHEDPRYFRVPQQHAFKSRVGNVAKLTFLARNESGRAAPAYARYIGIVGGNFLSNTWRVPSESNAGSAVLRASEGFAGRMAANAFQEFGPDLKRYIFRKLHRTVEPGTQAGIPLQTDHHN